MFKALLSGGMREGTEGEVRIEDVRAPVFRILLHFAYCDTLPEVNLPALGVTPAPSLRAFPAHNIRFSISPWSA